METPATGITRKEIGWVKQSAIGIVTWNTVLTGLGYYFYQYKDLFFHYLDKYKHVIFYTGIILLVIFALNAIRKKRAARGTNQEE